MSKTVLIVEDDSLIRGSLVRALQAAGLEVKEAANGKEGLEEATKGAIDLIVTDISMPEVDGLTMLASLREHKTSKDIPAIVLSSDEDANSINQAMTAGVTAYLSKNSLDADAVVEQVLATLD